MSTESLIYRGFWVDFSSPVIKGATLTLMTRDGAFLISFLTTYITIAAGFSWKIVAVALHHCRAHELSADRDGMWNQTQAILRNAESPTTVGYQSILVLWAWRKKQKWTTLIGCCGIILLAACVSAAFTLASVFSGQVTKSASNNMLLRSENCGPWEIPKTTQASNDEWQSLVLQSTLASAQYARMCYSDSSSDLTCNQYTSRTVQFTTNVNATCPFETDLCFFPGDSAYSMDTGFLDSNDALGLNSPKRERVLYRRLTTCSLLHTKDHAEQGTATLGGGSFVDPMIYLHMGSIPSAGLNYTYSYNIHSLVDGIGYLLTYVLVLRLRHDTKTDQSYRPMIAYATGPNVWTPIAALNRTDADVTLVILAQNSVQYDQPSDDPYFSAHVAHDLTAAGVELTWYLGDDYFNLLACADQHQFCNPNLNFPNDGCTPLTDSTAVLDELLTLGLSEVQSVTAKRITNALPFGSIYDSINGRGASALRASETCFGDNQMPLPNNQWQIELNAWFATSMARLQQSMVDYAVGPSNVLPDERIVHASSNADKLMCHSQKIKARVGYQNFSVLGLVIILFTCSILILTGLVIEKLVERLQKTFWPKAYSRLAWIMDEKLQLQALAFSGAGWTTWERIGEDIPTISGALGHYARNEDPAVSISPPVSTKSASSTSSASSTLLTDSRDATNDPR